MRRGDLRIENGPRLARWNWGWLEGCFGDTKISASDIDAIWERRGHFFIVEVKGPDEELWQGQLILLRKLAALEKHFTVWLVRGERDVPSLVQRITASGLGPEEASSQEDFRGRMAAWFARVEAGQQQGPSEVKAERVSDGNVAIRLGLLRP